MIPSTSFDPKRKNGGKENNLQHIFLRSLFLLLNNSEVTIPSLKLVYKSQIFLFGYVPGQNFWDIFPPATLSNFESSGVLKLMFFVRGIISAPILSIIQYIGAV